MRAVGRRGTSTPALGQPVSGDLAVTSSVRGDARRGATAAGRFIRPGSVRNHTTPTDAPTIPTTRSRKLCNDESLGRILPRLPWSSSSCTTQRISPVSPTLTGFEPPDGNLDPMIALRRPKHHSSRSVSPSTSPWDEVFALPRRPLTCSPSRSASAVCPTPR
jgi:hypothetical protein